MGLVWTRTVRFLESDSSVVVRVSLFRFSLNDTEPGPEPTRVVHSGSDETLVPLNVGVRSDSGPRTSETEETGD